MRILPLCLILTFVPLRLITAQELDVPFYVTEPEVVEGMLDMAGVGPGDYLIDLGRVTDASSLLRHAGGRWTWRGPGPPA
jgi:hypothetical protein